MDNELKPPIDVPGEPTSASIVDKLLATYEPDDKAEWVDPTDGEVYTFKTWKSSDDYEAFLQRAAAWYGKLPEAQSAEAETHPFSGFLPASWAQAYKAFMIHEMSLAPKFEQLDALRLMKAPHLSNGMVRAIQQAARTVEAVRRNAIFNDFLKNSLTTLGED
jgi:hypothetical protein